MKLDKHVVDMFTELTKPADDVKMEKTCYGTISVVDGTRYVKLDGSDLLVPAASTVKTSHGDRVTVLMKNHSLTVTGNLTAPATDGEGSSPGEAGTAATIEVGTVTTGEAGSSASVTNSGTTSAAVFDFVIPKGDKGEKGDVGPQGEAGTAATIKVGRVTTVEGAILASVTNSGTTSAAVFDFVIPRGEKGEKGDTGTWDGTIPDHEHTISDITDFPTSLPANGGNAETLDGLHTNELVQCIGKITSSTIANDPNYGISYEGNLAPATAVEIGLPSGWYHLKYLKHQDSGDVGWGLQIALPLTKTTYLPMYRFAANDETSWSTWHAFADGGNADTLDGLHASNFSQIINLGHTSTDTKNALGIRYQTTAYWCFNWTDYPAGMYDGQGMIIAAHYNSYGTTVGVDSIWCRQIFISPHPNTKIYQRIIANTDVGEWTSISDGGNADTLDGLHANEIAINPNQLINPDFKINQRGQAEYTGSTYTVDCWRKNAGGSVTIKDGKLILSADALIRQPMEYADKLSGQKVTVLIKANGTIRSKSSVFPTDTSNFAFYYDEDIIITRYIDDSATWFVITAKKEVSIEWVKLELGSVATPFVPPDPATELLKCQRYFQKYSNGTIGTGYAISGTQAIVFLPLKTNLRGLSGVNVKLNGTLSLATVTHSGSNSLNCTSVTYNKTSTSYCKVVCTAAGLTAGEPVEAQIRTAGDMLLLSAEL